MKKLDLPRYRNFNNYSCFVTTTAMILRYYKKRINQKKIFEKAKVYSPNNKKRCIGTTVPSLMLALKNSGYKMIHYHDKYQDNSKFSSEIIALFKIEAMQRKKAIKLGILEDKMPGDFAYIEKFLDKGIPVIVGVKSKDFYSGNPNWENSIYNKKWPETTRHVIVITGYTKNKYFFNDSSPFFSGAEGKDRVISKNILKKASTNKSIFILKKIKR